jgi:hypothetical protein
MNRVLELAPEHISLATPKGGDAGQQDTRRIDRSASNGSADARLSRFRVSVGASFRAVRCALGDVSMSRRDEASCKG